MPRKVVGSAFAGKEKTGHAAGRPAPSGSRLSRPRRLWESAGAAAQHGGVMDEGRTLPLVAAPSAWGVDPKAARPVAGRGIFATIATADRIAQSRTFARSARPHHPDARLALLVL